MAYALMIGMTKCYVLVNDSGEVIIGVYSELCFANVAKDRLRAQGKLAYPMILEFIVDDMPIPEPFNTPRVK